MNKSRPVFDEHSRVTSFWGTGASGATTFSLEYANQVSRAGRKTLLLDHDLIDPSLMVYLAIDNYPSGLQAGLRLASQNRLSPTNIEELIIQSDDNPNLSIMAGLPVSGRFMSVSSESIEYLFEGLRSWFDELVIDLGCIFSEKVNPHVYGLQQQVISSSDEVLGVFRADPEGLAKLFWLPLSGELIANSYRPGSLGAGGKKGLKSVVAETTGKALLGIVEEDEQLTLAIARAVAVGDISKKSTVSQMVAGLIQNRLDSSR